MSEPNESPLPVITTRRAMRAHVDGLRAEGKKIGLVPTMGALHAGHLSLVEESASQCEATIVSIFVNPTQFGPSEDLDAYPRTLQSDCQSLSAHSVSAVFAPEKEEMFPTGASTFVEPPSVALPLEGRCRPGHFRGVATVVLKLFHLIPADIAFFGDKDYQQALVIRRMVEELNLSIQIATCPTIREKDGLAMSSRNAYLSSSERAQAVAIGQALDLAESLIGQGQLNAGTVAAHMRQTLVSAGITQIDYLALADPQTLEEVDEIPTEVQALIAARVGQTRLIDNRKIHR